MAADSVINSTTLMANQQNEEEALEEYWITVLKYWIDGPCCLSLSVLGILANVVALVALARQRVQRIFHLLMMFLSVWDLFYLFLSILCFSLPVMSVHYRDQVFIHALPYAVPLAQIAYSGSCYSTVALTIERYIAVCVPFFRLRHNITLKLYVLPILVFAPVYNIPRFFEFETVTSVAYYCAQWAHTDAVIATNDTFRLAEDSPRSTLLVQEDEFLRMSSEERSACLLWQEKATIDLNITGFRKNHAYISVYVNLLNWLVNLIIPTGVLVVLNCLIYRALRRNKLMGEQLRRNGGGEKESLRKRDVRLTRVAIAIVCVFICCHLPRFIPNFVELFTAELPKFFVVVVSFNNLLQTINCSVNYIIYYGHGWKRTVDLREDLELDSRSILRHRHHMVDFQMSSGRFFVKRIEAL